MKPFLKWAGNKYQIIQQIKAILPAGNRLIEPFTGSGAVFLNTTYPHYLLADTNNDLITLYQLIKVEGVSFITFCKQFFRPENNCKEAFYDLRQQFNTTTDHRLKAALFVYLNKHCFNGLCRYNTTGKFNTPFGKYTTPYFPEKEMYFFHEQAKKAVFNAADFITTMESAISGDVIYCDPPYVPLSATANFTGYSVGGFTERQQIKLAQLANQLAARGITVIISNHQTDFTDAIYKPAQLITVEVQRYISRDGANRKKVTEVLAVFK